MGRRRGVERAGRGAMRRPRPLPCTAGTAVQRASSGSMHTVVRAALGSCRPCGSAANPASSAAAVAAALPPPQRHCHPHLVSAVPRVVSSSRASTRLGITLGTPNPAPTPAPTQHTSVGHTHHTQCSSFGGWSRWAPPPGCCPTPPGWLPPSLWRSRPARPAEQQGACVGRATGARMRSTAGAPLSPARAPRGLALTPGPSTASHLQHAATQGSALGWPVQPPAHPPPRRLGPHRPAWQHPLTRPPAAPSSAARPSG